MFDKNQLESTLFYTRAYGNFATKLLWPLFLLVIFIVIFMTFGKKEVIVTSVASIDPVTPVTTVQSSSNNIVKNNELSEGKLVKKGDVLLTFDSTPMTNDQIIGQQKETTIANKLASLNTLKQSVSVGQNQFNGVDDYGYKNQFDSYNAQISEINVLEKQATKSDSGATKDQINDQNKLSQLKRDNLKAQTLSTIQAEINTLNDALLDSNGQSNALTAELNNQQVLAPSDGVLHVINEQTSNQYFPVGTEIAYIYPEITDKSAIIATFYVPADKLNNLDVDQNIRFKSEQDSAKPLILKGSITNIATAPTSIKEQPFYRIQAKLDTNGDNYSQIRHGMIGNITVVTGQKTWFNYVKDLIFTTA